MLPHWRKMTWAVVLWTAFFALVIAAMLLGWNTDNCHGSGPCEGDEEAGIALVAVMTGLIGIAGLVLLAIGWLVTIPRSRDVGK